MPTMHEAAGVSTPALALTEPLTFTQPFRYVNERILGALASLQVGIMERKQRIEDNWATMSRVQRAGVWITTILGSTAGAVVGFRASGAAAHGLEDALLTYLPDVHTSIQRVPANKPALPQVPKPQQQDTPSFVAPGAHDHGINLPADTNKAPDPVRLGAYNDATKSGTEWTWAVRYADELGYGNLTKPQQWAVTNELLQTDGVTWDGARSLGSDHQIDFPTQAKMIDILNRSGATQTHAADRPAAANAPPQGGTTGPGAGIQETSPGTPCQDCDYDLWGFNPFINWFDYKWDTKDTVTLAATGAVLALAYAVHKEHERRRAQALATDTDNPPSDAKDPEPPPAHAATDPTPAPTIKTPDKHGSGRAAKTAATVLTLAAILAAGYGLWKRRKYFRRKQ
jgi:hypothetical protein